MIVTTIPFAFAADGEALTLDVADGRIYITEEGYFRGETGTIIPYTGDYIITGNTTTEKTTVDFVISEGAVVNAVFKDLAINKKGIEWSYPVSVCGAGTLNLTLEGENKLYGGDDCGGLVLCDTVTLVITENSTGSLLAEAGYAAAGIGTRNQRPEYTPNIIIKGGNITATGGDDGAGIGAGLQAGFGDITITGGTVTATGGEYGAGIGSGAFSDIGTIRVIGGTVNATKGYNAEDDIGNGYYSTVKCKFVNYETTEEATCTQNEVKTSICSICSGIDTIEIEGSKTPHTPLEAVKENEVAPKCDVAGSYDSVVYCDDCDAELSRETVAVDALTHADEDGDYICDNGCGYEYEKPAEPTPEEPVEICPDCGRPVHEGAVEDMICIIIAVIKIIISYIK